MEDDPVPCPKCDGRGEYLDAPQNVLDGPSYMQPCEVCGGTGRVQTITPAED